MPSEQSETTHSAASPAAFAANSASDTAAATAGSATALTPRQELVIECLRNARYHEDRERFFSWVHKSAMFVVVAAGTASFASLKAEPQWAAIITLTGLLDLVFDISGRARLHGSLRRRFYDLPAQSEIPTISDESLREQATRIYGDEPPCMHAANVIAYNGAMDSFHRPRKYLYKIEWYHRLLRHVWPFASTQFKTFGELATTDGPMQSASDL
jgi:hypothetical protein